MGEVLEEVLASRSLLPAFEEAPRPSVSLLKIQGGKFVESRRRFGGRRGFYLGRGSGDRSGGGGNSGGGSRVK